MSNTAWSLQALRTHVSSKYKNADPILATIASIDRCTRIFGYHVVSARDALKGLVDERDASSPENWLLALGGSERQEEFALARVVSEAHILGCLHTVRSLLDIFAQLAKQLLQPLPLAVENCDAKTLVKVMLNSPLRARLASLLRSDWGKYVIAFVNVTKHRQLIEHTMTISSEENRVGIRLMGFSYARENFSSYWAPDVLRGAMEVKNAVVELGRMLNQAVIARDA